MIRGLTYPTNTLAEGGPRRSPLNGGAAALTVGEAGCPHTVCYKNHQGQRSKYLSVLILIEVPGCMVQHRLTRALILCVGSARR